MAVRHSRNPLPRAQASKKLPAGVRPTTRPAVNPDARRWLLRAFLLLPAFWVLRDTVRLHAGDYVSLVVVPWAVLVLASWLLAGRIYDPREDRLRLVLAVTAIVCGWGALQTGRTATRVMLVPCLVAAASCVARPLARAAIAA